MPFLTRFVVELLQYTRRLNLKLMRSCVSKYDPTILVVVVSLSIAAVSLTGFGCSKLDHTIGSVKDADFWFLVQSSILQIAGMAPVLHSLAIAKDSPLQPRIWSWICLGINFILCVIAPIIYLVTPTEYSGVIACFGSVAQVCMILEAMFLVTRGKALTR